MLLRVFITSPSPPVASMKRHAMSVRFKERPFELERIEERDGSSPVGSSLLTTNADKLRFVEVQELLKHDDIPNGGSLGS